MKKIGIVSSGNVIVEMTEQEFDALRQFQMGGSTSPSMAQSSREVAPTMNHSERATYVSERLRKLAPKKKDGVIRSIEVMFQFSGGIDSLEVDKLLATLQKEKFFTISSDGRVVYK